MSYRYSRNIEASLIQKIETILSDNGWTDINVEKSFQRVYNSTLPAICIRCGNTNHLPVEIGNTSTRREVQILIDIFATNDGQRLDLKDTLVSELKSGLIYYEYTIENGNIETKTVQGRIRILNINDTIINLNVDKASVNKKDKFRHLLDLTISLGKVES